MGYELYLKERKEVLTNIDSKSNLVSLREEEKEEEEEIPRSSWFRSNQYYQYHIFCIPLNEILSNTCSDGELDFSELLNAFKHLCPVVATDKDKEENGLCLMQYFKI